MPWTCSLRSAHLGSKYSHTSWALTFLRPSVKLFCSQTVPLWAHCQCQVMLPGFSSDYTLSQCKWGMLFKMLSLFFYHSGLRHERIKKLQAYFLLWIVEKATNLWLTKEIQPVHSKGDQPWVFFGRTDAKAQTPILWPPRAKSWLIGKDSDAGREWGQEEKGTTEDEMAGWHHWLDGRESEWTLGVGDGQGGLACYNSWGCRESDTTERLNWGTKETGGQLTFIYPHPHLTLYPYSYLYPYLL